MENTVQLCDCLKELLLLGSKKYFLFLLKDMKDAGMLIEMLLCGQEKFFSVILMCGELFSLTPVDCVNTQCSQQ